MEAAETIQSTHQHSVTPSQHCCGPTTVSTHLDHVDERVTNIALVLEINWKVEEIVGAL